MNITSVVVFSDADRNSLHVEMADEAFYIGPPPSAQSYLNIDAICKIALEAKVDAVHPGFGFLSENFNFAQKLKEIGVHFIGPDSEIIKIMGDKIAAKNIAAQAGVNIIEGYTDDVGDIDNLMSIAETIGFPVIIKAAAGGGGKGMRIVNSSAEMEEAVQRASSEAEKSFGDGRVFIEKYVERPRHIEIQILGDKFGNIVCLGERECSIQRRYQKVIEEAPSSFINEKVRKQMYEQSVKLAQKVGYYSAGTVEFVMDQDKNFYFLEMNTRIQVEHPVTELVTNIDLIAEMINIEAGKAIPFTQEDIKIKGHAIEARVYAENPANDFLPATGKITNYIALENENIRIDSGVELGSEVTMFYDPMLAKICAHGESRVQAISNLRFALNNFHIAGVENNVLFLQSIVKHPDFASAKLYTGFIKDWYPNGFDTDNLSIEIEQIFVDVILYIHLHNEYRKQNMFNSRNKLEDDFIVDIAGKTHKVSAEYFPGVIKIKHKQKKTVMLNTSWVPEKTIFYANLNDSEIIVKLNRYDSDYILEHDGCKAKCKVYRGDYAHLLKFMPPDVSQNNENEVVAPITGMITRIYIKEGEEVKVGQPLFIIEAMKMENTFYAKAKGMISKINYSEGESVNLNDVIIEFLL